MKTEMKKIRESLGEQMTTVTQKDAAKNFGQIYKRAQRSPVAVSFHGLPDILMIRVSGCDTEFIKQLFDLLGIRFPDIPRTPASPDVAPLQATTTVDHTAEQSELVKQSPRPKPQASPKSKRELGPLEELWG